MREHVTLASDQLLTYLSARPYLSVENIPLADDVVDKYAVPGWGLLTKQIEDPATDPAELGKLRSKRAKLFMKAVHNSDVYFGPVREREEVTPEPEPTPEPADENPNEWRIVRAMNKLGGNFKQHWNNTTSYFKENKSKASAGLLVGALAGFGIVTGVHMGTEQIMNGLRAIGLTHPALDWLIGASINVGGSWAINQKFFLDRVVRKWTVPKITDSSYRKENNLVPYDVLTEEQQKKIDLDTNGMISSVVIGDIAGKMIGAILPVKAMLQRIGDGVHAFKDWVHGQGSGTDTPVVETQVSQVVQPTPVESVVPDQAGENLVQPGAGEPPIALPDAQPPLVDTHGLEHVVQGNDEMLTQILVDHGLQPYSGDYIRLLSDNKDVFAEMLYKTYPDGNVPVLVDIASKSWDHIPVEQAVQNLKEVIAAGYPDPETMSAEAYRAALTKMFNAVRYLLPGTEIEIPTP